MKPKPSHKNLFYVLVCLSPLVDEPGQNRRPDQFFVLTQEEANRLEKEYREARPNSRGGGFKFDEAIPYRDKWEKLPRDTNPAA